MRYHAPTPDSGTLFDTDDDIQEGSVSSELEADEGLQAVTAWFRSHQDLESRFGWVFRQSFDEVLDGQRTGRFDINDLGKVEKTYIGTKVEIITQASFELPRGRYMDYTVADHEIDAKFSIKGSKGQYAQWEIPTEAVGHLCVVMHANDHKGVFSVGVVRISSEILTESQNKDGKRRIKSKSNIVWLLQDRPLPPNLLLSLPKATSAKIMSAPSGQKRINELLRTVHRRTIERNTAITVARQDDGLKRCRDARKHLRPEGIVVLGHQNDCPAIATDLGLPIPRKGSFIAARLVRTAPGHDDRPTTRIGGDYYAIAHPSDPIEPAPVIKY